MAAKENPVAAIDAGEPGREVSLVRPVSLSDMRVKYWKVSRCTFLSRAMSLELMPDIAGSAASAGEKKFIATKSGRILPNRNLSVGTGFDFRKFFFKPGGHQPRIAFIFTDNIF